MKHNIKITVILILLFVLTQFIGLFIISFYNSPLKTLPYGMQPPVEVRESFSIYNLIITFILAISLFFILTKIKAEKIIKVWFFVVIVIALGLAFTPFFNVFLKIKEPYDSFIALAVGVIITYFKVIRRNLIIHNISEIIIYPGISAIFIPFLDVVRIIILLFIISLYDIWAVWHSDFMQKMAHYQINNLKIFTGFFIPYADKKQKEKIKKIKEMSKGKNEKFFQEQIRKAKVKVNLAILGGGDIIFPLITAGVFFIFFNFISSLIIIFFSVLSLFVLFLLAEKGKFYPAMPFLTIGIYLGMILNWILISRGII